MPYSICGPKRPSCHSPLPKSVWKTVPSLPEVPHSGFGYPLCGVSHSKPRKPLSVPNALGLRPTKPCSFLMIESPSRMTLSVHALSHETLTDLIPALQRLNPTRKAVPLLLPTRGLVWSEAYCSLGLYDLLGSLLSLTHEVSFSLTPSPSRP
jgi:hypothetical protein